MVNLIQVTNAKLLKDALNEIIATSALKTNAVGSFEFSVDPTTFVLSLQAKDVNGTDLGSPATVDLPIESMVIGGTYDSATKKLILSLQNGTSIEVSLSDLLIGLQPTIDSAHKLSSDLVDDTDKTHKFVSAAEKEAIASISTLAGKISTAETDIDTLERSVGDIQVSLVNVAGDVSNNTTAIGNLNTAVQTNTNNIAANSSSINTLNTNKANKVSYDTKILVVTDWVNNKYTLDLTASGKTANNHVDVFPWNGEDVENVTDGAVETNNYAVASAGIYRIIDNGTSITLCCKDTPTQNLYIRVEVHD